MRNYTHHNPSVGDVVIIKSEEFNKFDKRTYLTVAEILNQEEVICICGRTLKTVKLHVSLLLHIESSDKFGANMKPIY